jgi:hypothetical protein
MRKRRNEKAAGTQVRRRAARGESSQDAPGVPPVDLSLRIKDVATAVKTPTPARKRRKPFVL